MLALGGEADQTIEGYRRALLTPNRHRPDQNLAARRAPDRVLANAAGANSALRDLPLTGEQQSARLLLVQPASWLVCRSEAAVTEQRVQRRLAAILAADVVGYSTLMQRAEAATYAEFERLKRELIEPSLSRHEGRLIKRRAGIAGRTDWRSAATRQTKWTRDNRRAPRPSFDC